MKTRKSPSPLDFTCRATDGGLFVALFPESPAAVEIWNHQIGPQTENTGKILAIHWPAVKSQLRAAGYVVRKAGRRKASGGKATAATAAADAELLRQLVG